MKMSKKIKEFMKEAEPIYDKGLEDKKEEILEIIDRCEVIEVRQDLEQEGVEYVLIEREELISKIRSKDATI